MAQPAIERFNRRLLLLKIEATEGTDATPAPGTDAFQIMDGQSKIEGDTIERNIDRADLTASPFAFTNSRGTLSGSIELVPPAAPGTDAAAVGTLLRIAGMSETLDAVGPPKSTRYAPVSTGFESATAYWDHGGTRRKILGSRADISSLMLSIDDYFKAQFNLTGFCDGVTEQAIATGADFSAFREPVVSTDVNSTLKIGEAGSAPTLSTWSKSLSVDFGLGVQTNRYTEHKETSVNSRDGKFTIVMARPAQADFDPWALRAAGTLIEAQYRLSQGSNLYSEIGIRGQIEGIDEQNTEDRYLLQLTGRCIASDSGNDDYYVEFGDTTT